MVAEWMEIVEDLAVVDDGRGDGAVEMVMMMEVRERSGDMMVGKCSGLCGDDGRRIV